MSWLIDNIWYIVIGLIVITLVIIIAYQIFKCTKRSTPVSESSSSTATKPELSKKESDDEFDTIALVCVKRKAGSNPDGLETDEELAARLYRLNRNTFLKQEVSDKEKPYDKKDWDKIYDDKNAVDARVKFEKEHLFLLDQNGKINTKTAGFLTKKFKKKN